MSADIAAACYEAFQRGASKDAMPDMEGFKNVLALRARHTGKSAQPPEKYLDQRYFQKALTLSQRSSQY